MRNSKIAFLHCYILWGFFLGRTGLSVGIPPSLLTFQLGVFLHLGYVEMPNKGD